MIKRVGDWDKVARVISNLSSEMQKAQIQSLQQWGLKAEALAVGHMSTQDLGWEELKASTIASKVRKGQSENILIATSSYFGSITSWVDKGTSTVYAGVRRTERDKDGNIIADIAKLHEYGSSARGVPARPLWQPTLDELSEWFPKSKSRPSEIFIKNIKKYAI